MTTTQAHSNRCDREADFAQPGTDKAESKPALGFVRTTGAALRSVPEPSCLVFAGSKWSVLSRSHVQLLPRKRVASETNRAVRVCRIWCGLPNISASDVVVVISHDQRGRTPSDFEIVHHWSSAFRVPRTCADGDFRAQVAF